MDGRHARRQPPNPEGSTKRKQKWETFQEKLVVFNHMKDSGETVASVSINSNISYSTNRKYIT